MAEKDYPNSMISITMCMFYLGGMLFSLFIVWIMSKVPYYKLNFLFLLIMGGLQALAALSVEMPAGIHFEVLMISLRLLQGGSYTCIMTNVACQVYRVLKDPFELAKNLFFNAMLTEIGFNFGPFYVSMVYLYVESPQIAHGLVGLLCVLLAIFSLIAGDEPAQGENIEDIHMELGEHMIKRDADSSTDHKNSKTNQLPNPHEHQNQNQNQSHETSQIVSTSKKPRKLASNNSHSHSQSQEEKIEREFRMCEFFANPRLIMNVVLLVMDNAFEVFILQVIISSLMKPPYNLGLQTASMYTTFGTFAIVVNALVIYVYTYVLHDGSDHDHEDLQYEAPLLNNPVITMNNSMIVSHSIYNLQEIRNKLRVRQEKTLRFEHSSNLNLKTQQFQNLNTYLMTNNIANFSLINSIYQNQFDLLEEEEEVVEHGDDCHATKTFHDPIHNRHLIFVGRICYTSGYFVIAPMWFTDDLDLLMIFAPVGMCLICLGYCYSYIHMNLEFVQAVKAYMHSRRLAGDFIQESSTLDTSNALLMILWQLGSLFMPLLFSIVLDHTNFGVATLLVSQVNMVLTLLYASVLFFYSFSPDSNNSDPHSDAQIKDKEKGLLEPNHKETHFNLQLQTNQKLKEIEVN